MGGCGGFSVGRVREQHHRTSGCCHSRFSLWPWLLVEVIKEVPPALCMLVGSSFLALAVIGSACFFAGQVSSPAPGQSRPLEVRCSESTQVSIDAFDREGGKERDAKRTDGWHSFRDTGFLAGVRLEDPKYVGVAVRKSQCGLEIATPCGVAKAGVPDAIGLWLSPISHSLACGDIVVVSLVEVTSDSPDLLEPLWVVVGRRWMPLRSGATS